MAGNEEKEKNLERAISQVEKQFGEGSVMRLGKGATHLDVEAIPSTSMSCSSPSPTPPSKPWR